MQLAEEAEPSTSDNEKPIPFISDAFSGSKPHCTGIYSADRPRPSKNNLHKNSKKTLDRQMNSAEV